MADDINFGAASPDYTQQLVEQSPTFSGRLTGDAVPAVSLGADNLPGGYNTQGFDMNPEAQTTNIQRESSLIDHMKFAVPGVAAAITDTVGTSLGFLGEKDVTNGLMKYGPQGMGDYYARNKEGLQLAGDLASFLIPATAGAKAITAGSWLYRGLRNVGASEAVLGKVFASAGDIAEATASVTRRNMLLAGSATLNPVTDPIRATLVANTYKGVAVDAVKKYIGSEVAMYATMNTSQTFYPSDMGLAGQVMLHSAGAGLAVGIDVAFARSAMRRGLRAAEFTDARSAVLNPEDRQFVTDVANNRDFSVVNNALQANDLRALMQTSADADLKTNLNKVINEYDGQVLGAFEGIVNDGLKGIVSSTKKLDKEAVQTLAGAAKKDPSVFIGTKAIEGLEQTPLSRAEQGGKIAAQIDAWKQGIETATENLGKARFQATAEGFQKEIETLTKNIEDYKNFKASVLEPDGSLSNIDTRLDYFHDTGSLLDVKIVQPGKGADIRTFRLDATNPVTKQAYTAGIADNLTMYYPGGAKDIVSLGTHEQSAMFAVAQRFVDNFSKGRGLTDRIVLNEKSDSLQLDIARSILQKDPSAAAEFAVPSAWQGDIATALENASLEAKYKQFSKGMDKFNAQGTPAFLKSMNGISTGLPYSLQHIEYGLNLAKTPGGEANPLLDLFTHVYMGGDKTLASALGRMEHVDGLAKETLMKIGGVTSENLTPDLLKWLQSANIPTMGTNLAEPLAKNGTDFIRPQVLWQKPVPWDMTKSSMDLYSAAQKTEFLDKLGQAPGFVSTVVNNILDLPAAKAARQVDTIVEGQQAGKGVGVYQNMAVRDLDVFTATGIVSNVFEKAAEVEKKRVFDQVLGPALSALNKDEASIFQFAQFDQARQFGFRMKPQIEQAADGSVKFLLETQPARNGLGYKHSDVNKKAWQRAFGTELPDGQQYLPLIDGEGKTALSVPSTAYEAIKAISSVHDDFYQTANFFRDLYNKSPIPYKAFHMPPRDMNKPFVKYLFNPAEEGGQPIKAYLTADSASELSRKMNTEVIQDMLSNKGYIAVDAGDIRRFHHLQDEAFFNMVDYTDTLAQTGGVRTGGNQLVEYGKQRLKDITDSIANQISTNGRRAVSAMYQDEIQYARMQDHMVSAAEATKGPSEKITIWKQYLDSLLGTSYYKRSNSAVFNAINADVPIFDGMLRKAADYYRALLPEVKENIDAGGTKIVASPSAKKIAEYERLKDGIPKEQFPFSDATDFINKTFKIETPVSLQKVSGALNATTVNLTLRMFETGRALVDMLSNVVALPLVTNSLRRQAYETEEQWRAKMSVLGADIGSEDVALPNMVRLLSKSVGDMFSNEGRGILNAAKQKGNIPEKMVDAYQAVHSPTDTDTVRWAKKAIDAVSYVSDKGEEWSRGMAYLAGYRIARDSLRLENENARHAMANLFMENTIGNYRATNRPLVFQGALGSPLGLFQTYMWNYYGRMFSYVENKQYRAMAINYALQAGTFGAASVPGWQQFNSMYMHAYTGHHDIVDQLDKAYTPQGAEILLHGTLANLPRLFGGDGVAFYSRGDTNVQKMPAYISPDNAPIVSLASNALGLFGAITNQARQGGQWSRQGTMEALGTYSLNRPIARMFEVAAGVSADQRGALVNADTQTAASITARLMGMRPLIEDNNRQALIRNRAAEQYQAELEQRTEVAIRSLFRGNVSPATLDEGISKAIQDHLNQGGNPASTAKFIRNAMIAATITKNDKSMYESLKNPGKLNETMRLVSAMTYGHFDREESPTQ